MVGDKAKRAKFDAGEIDGAGNPRGFDPGAQGFRQGPFGGNPYGGGDREFHFTWDNANPAGAQQGFNAEDIFSEILGGGRRGGGGRTKAARGEDFSAAVTAAFSEAVLGGTRRLVLPNGEQIDVKIPPGLKDGQQIRVKGRGGAGRNGGANGDVLIQVQVAAHPFLSRDGNDLNMDLPVTLKEAVAGGKVPVPTLSGTVNLSVPANSNTGTVLRLKGKGVPAHGGQPAGDTLRPAGGCPARQARCRAHPPALPKGWPGSYDPRRQDAVLKASGARPLNYPQGPVLRGGNGRSFRLAIPYQMTRDRDQNHRKDARMAFEGPAYEGQARPDHGRCQ